MAQLQRLWLDSLGHCHFGTFANANCLAVHVSVTLGQQTCRCHGAVGSEDWMGTIRGRNGRFEVDTESINIRKKDWKEADSWAVALLCAYLHQQTPRCVWVWGFSSS